MSGRPKWARPGTSADARSLTRNTVVLVSGRYLVAALGWAGTVLIVRTLSVEEWGRFSFVFSLLGLLSVLSELGIGRVSIRGLLGDADPDRFAGTLFVLRATLGIASYVFAVAFVVVAGYPQEVVRAVIVAGLVLVVATPSHALQAVFEAHLRMGTVAISMVAGQLCQLALIAALAVSGASVVRYVVPALVSEIVIIAWRLKAVQRLVHLRLNIDWPTWKRLLREAAPIAAGSILATAYYRVDSIMLSKLDTFESVGRYGIAYKFADLFHYLPVALMGSLLPQMVRSWPGDPLAYGETFRRALSILVVAGVIVAVEFAVFARPIIVLLYGEQYVPAVGAARIVVATESISALGLLFFTSLVAIDCHRLYPFAALAGLLINVGLNLVLIPAYSYLGSAVATALTEVAVVSILIVPMLRVKAIRPLPWRLLAITPVAGAFAGLVGLGLVRIWAWPAAALVAAAIYLGVLRITRAVDPGDRLGLGVGTSP